MAMPSIISKSIQISEQISDNQTVMNKEESSTQNIMAANQVGDAVANSPIRLTTAPVHFEENNQVVPRDILRLIVEELPRDDLLKIKQVSHLTHEIVESIIENDLKEITAFIQKDNDYQTWTIRDCKDLSGIKSLSINSAFLTSIPHSIYLLRRLESLELIDNQISLLPEEMDCLKHLKILNLDRNQIKEFPSVLAKIESLKEVHLVGNPIPRASFKEFDYHFKLIQNSR